MKKLIILLVLLLFVVSQGAFAQKTITGKVITAEDGTSLPGVYVVVSGTTTGTTTDANGNFTLNVSNNAIIRVSFVGYKTVEILVRNQTQFDIMLEPDVQTLGDVVVSTARAERVIPPERAIVTAMGIVRDKLTLTYSIGSISGYIVARNATQDNPFYGFEGRIAGFNNGQFRGRTSFNFQRGPLYVIDGVPVGSSPPVWLNLEEIGEVIFLKSANAAMLYGSEAANGAVVITLKWGK